MLDFVDEKQYNGMGYFKKGKGAKMKLSVSLPCFFKNVGFCESVRTVAAWGYDAVETWNIPEAEIDSARGVCLENGVTLAAMCTSEFRMTTPEHRALWLNGLRESSAVAQKVGAKMLITQVGKDTGEERARQHASILAALEGAKPILEEYGVMLIIEPLNTYVDHKGYYLFSSQEGFSLIEEANHPQIKLVYDIYHMQVMEGNIIPSVTAHLDKIAHLHAAGHPGRHEPWLGENDYRVIFDAIDRAGYTGYCGLEYRPTLDVCESLRMAKTLYGKK